MNQLFKRLREALADRYALERELGAGGMATVYGKPDSAALAYGRLVRLWDQADPELQSQVTEARDALRRLTAEPAL